MVGAAVVVATVTFSVSFRANAGDSVSASPNGSSASVFGWLVVFMIGGIVDVGLVLASVGVGVDLGVVAASAVVVVVVVVFVVVVVVLLLLAVAAVAVVVVVVVVGGGGGGGGGRPASPSSSLLPSPSP